MNIIISGVTCSGKSTLARDITGATIMPQDNYFKNLEDIPKYKGRYLMDSINAFLYDEYHQDATSLLKGGIVIPRYDIATNRRIAKDIPIERSDINVFEGLHTIKILSDMPNSLKIFLLTDLRECLRRRIERDSEKYRVRPNVIEEYFESVVIPMYKEYIEPQRKAADIIIKEGDDANWVLKKYIKN